jgi:hypothetical protein
MPQVGDKQANHDFQWEDPPAEISGITTELYDNLKTLEEHPDKWARVADYAEKKNASAVFNRLSKGKATTPLDFRNYLFKVSGVGSNGDDIRYGLWAKLKPEDEWIDEEDLDLEPPEPDDKKYPCPNCDMRFTSRQGVTMHNTLKHK